MFSWTVYEFFESAIEHEHRRISNINMRPRNYVKCLQTQCDNQRDFSVKLMSMFDGME